jgi:hypothetical protein
LGATQNLEKDGNRGLVEGHIIDFEFECGKVEQNVEVEVDIGTSGLRKARNSGATKGVQVRLGESIAERSLSRHWVGVGGSNIAQDGGIQASIETGGTDVRIRANPVIGDVLISVKDERITLTSEDLEIVDSVRGDTDTICFNDRLKSPS